MMIAHHDPTSHNHAIEERMCNGDCQHQHSRAGRRRHVHSNIVRDLVAKRRDGARRVLRAAAEQWESELGIHCCQGGINPAVDGTRGCVVQHGMSETATVCRLPPHAFDL
jgi:hypothetical protein